MDEQDRMINLARQVYDVGIIKPKPMTKEQHCRALIEAIYEATQKNITVKFSKDFTGQMTVSLDDAHTHVGVPGGTLKQMIEGATRWINGSVGAIVEEREQLAPAKYLSPRRGID